MKTVLLALSLLLSLPSSAADSLFRQSRTEIERNGAFACETTGIGAAIADVSSLCGAPIQAWRDFSSSLITTGDFASSASRNDALTRVVFRNTLITEAYAALYLRSQRSLPACGRSLLPWVGGASLGSLKSGQVMRTGLSIHVGGLTEFDQLKDANYRRRFLKIFGPGLGRIALESATLALGEGNKAIFEDLYWQLLAGVTCGPAAVVAMIERDPKWTTEHKLLRSHKAWTLLTSAAPTCDRHKVKLANQSFVEIEQYLVGQNVMYGGFINSLGGRLLTPTVEAALPKALGSFPSFLEHAKGSNWRWKISFANADQRVSWMKDQLGVMEEAFSSRAELLHPLFCSVTRDSIQTRKLLMRVSSSAE